MDPFEKMDHEGQGYGQWWAEHMFLFAPSAVKVEAFMETFKEYPQRQKPASWVIE
jgi:arylsulfatase